MSKQKGNIYFWGGVNGVGKSSILKELVKKHPEFKVFRGSLELMKWLSIRRGDYDTLISLPNNYKNAESIKMMNRLIHRGVSKNKTLIIDAHYLNYEQGRVIDLPDEWMASIDAMFVISASPATILKRITADQINNDRHRNLLPINTTREQKIKIINQFLSVTVNKAIKISKKYKIPYFIIDNNIGQSHAVENFLKYHFSLQKRKI